MTRKYTRPTDKYLKYAGWVDSVAQRLNLAILKDGRSVAEICRQCNIDPHSLERYRRGYILPQVVILKAICEVLRIKMSDILGE